MELIADSWFMELGELSDGHALMAGVLLKTQLDTFRKTGHLLDFSQEYVRRKLTSTTSVLRLGNMYCRCLRCGCRQRLAYWMEAVIFDQEARERRIEAAAPGAGGTVVYLRQCMGNEFAETAMLVLNVDLSERD